MGERGSGGVRSGTAVDAAARVGGGRSEEEAANGRLRTAEVTRRRAEDDLLVDLSSELAPFADDID